MSGPLFVVAPGTYHRAMDDVVPDWARDRFALHNAQVGEERVPYLAGGSGEPLVLVHGLSSSMDWWRYNAGPLAAHFCVYLIDLPGFGRLGHLDTADSMAAYADWILDWMDAAGLPRADFAGHSMGGNIILRLAADRPERARRLVLIAPAGVLPSSEVPRYIAPVLKTVRQIPPALLPQVVRDIRRASFRTTLRSGIEMIEHDVLDILPRVRARSLLLWGEDDPIIPFDLAESFVERMPDVQLQVIKGVGHIPMIDAPELFNQAVIAFLSEGRETWFDSTAPEQH